MSQNVIRHIQSAVNNKTPPTIFVSMRLLSAFDSIIKNLRREYRMVDNLLVEALGLHIVAGDTLVNCYMCNLRQPSIIEGVLSWLCVARWFDFSHNLLYVLADVDDMECQM